MKKREYRPFLCSIGIFLMGYLGLGISIFPYIIPFQYNLQEAAASGPGLSLLLVGVGPIVTAYIGLHWLLLLYIQGEKQP